MNLKKALTIVHELAQKMVCDTIGFVDTNEDTRALDEVQHYIETMADNPHPHDHYDDGKHHGGL